MANVLPQGHPGTQWQRPAVTVGLPWRQRSTKMLGIVALFAILLTTLDVGRAMLQRGLHAEASGETPAGELAPWEPD